LVDSVFVFWPSLIPRHWVVISGRSLWYLAGFGGSLRGKCRNLGNHRLRGWRGWILACDL